MNHEWLDHLPLPAGIIRQQRYVYVNEAFLELTALTREQVLGQPLDVPVAPEHRERVRERHARRLKGEPVPSSYELAVLRGDGQRRTVEIVVALLGEDTLLQLHDITGRVARHENLKAMARLGVTVQRELSEEAIFRAVGEGMRALDAAVVRLAPDGDGLRLVEALGAVGLLVTEVGREAMGARKPWTPGAKLAWAEGYAFVDDLKISAARFLGEQHHEAVRRNIGARSWHCGAMVRLDTMGAPRELLLVMAQWLRPEDQPTITLFGAQICAALDAARVIRDLSRRNAELTALNAVATAAGTVPDFKQLVEQCGRSLAAVNGCTALAVYLLDDSGTTVSLAHVCGGSEEATRLFARLPVEGTRVGEVVRARAPRVIRRTDYDALRQEVLGRMGQEVIISVPMMVRSRVIGVVNAALSAPRDVGREEIDLVSGMVAHLTAAVEATRLVEDLRHSYHELSQAQTQVVQHERLAALGEMAAAVAHEVRNPLGVIFNALAGLKGAGAEQGDGPSLLGILQEESERIDNLVGDLLEFARPAMPKVAPGVFLRPALTEAVESVLATSGATVDFELAVGPGAEQVSMDARLMRQVFVNLTGNAVHAMPNGGRLSVTVEREEKPTGPVVQVAFEDSGQGISAEVLPRIFEPFFTTRARGTGLGLALVRRIVAGHRGEVLASSEPGKGARFVVRWPME